MGLPYVRKKDAPDTMYHSFKPVHGQRAGLGSGAEVDADTGESPIARWIAFAFDYSDFASNPDAVGNIVRGIVPRGTMALRCLVRVDTLFEGTGNDDIDIGDGDDGAGWADGLDFTSTGIKADPDSAYNWHLNGTLRLYEHGDTLDVLFKNATAPTAGEAIVFLEVISYHENLSAEW